MTTKSAAKKSTKPAKKPAKKDPPTTGQSGPKITLNPKKVEKHSREGINPKESAVMAILRKKGEATIEDLTAAFPNQSAKKANSWVRNSLRRLVRARLAKKIGRGTYKKAA